MQTILNRRSVRKFTEEPITEAELERILRAGMQAPSALNQQPWEFIVIRNADTKQKLLELSPYATPAVSADVDILVMADITRTKSQREWWVQDLSACVQNMLLEAEYLGLGGVWMGGYPDMERVRGLQELFSLPQNIIPFATVAFGHPAEHPAPVDRFDPKRIHTEKY